MTTSCAYCGRPATSKIPANPPNVCFEHASEFWTGLLAYAVDRDVEVTHDRECQFDACGPDAASRGIISAAA